MAKPHLGLPLVAFMAVTSIQGADKYHSQTIGLQMAVVFPTSPDLRLTAGSPGLLLGVHGTWIFADQHLLRPRLDYTHFLSQSQTSSLPALTQTIDTRVSSLAFGFDYLYRLSGKRSDWALGLGVVEIRWAVASTNRINPARGGSVAASGTSHWANLGVGPVVSFRISDHQEVEARLITSRYGQEKQPANTASIGLLWHF